MESLLDPRTLKILDLVLNLLAFFLGFAATCAGVFVAVRMGRLKSPAWQRELSLAFLMAGGSLTLRTFAFSLYRLGWLPSWLTWLVAELALLALGGTLLWAFVILDGYLRRKEEA